GQLILAADGAGATPSETLQKAATQKGSLQKASSLHLVDRALNHAELTCTEEAVTPERLQSFELPPVPPDDDVLDVRYGSGRTLETIGEKDTRHIPIVLQGIRYPLSISWHIGDFSGKASLNIDGRRVDLRSGDTISIAKPI